MTHWKTPTRRHVVRGIAALSFIGLSGCTRVLSEVSSWGTDARHIPDIPYGPAARHKLDLYLPREVRADTPLVQFLYGGSWKWGSRNRYGFVGYALADQGFAVAIPDYRLHPEVRFPAFNFDAARAAAWLQRNRSNYGLSAGPLHLMGHSAGAHIGALLALDPRYLGNFGMSRDEIGGFVGLAGPYGMYPSKVGYIADIFPPADREDQARPVTFARADAPPMLLLHGLDDGLVKPENSTALADVQKAKGADASARLYNGVGHKELVVALAPPFQGMAPVLSDTAAFLKSV